MNQKTITTKFPCSYCGGWENVKQIDSVNDIITTGEHVAVKIDIPELGMYRDICAKCLLYVFDEVLGPPKAKEGKE